MLEDVVVLAQCPKQWKRNFFCINSDDLTDLQCNHHLNVLDSHFLYCDAQQMESG